MFTRNMIIFCTLAVLLAEADSDAVNMGLQAMSTDQDSTSSEAPTESINYISPYQLNGELHNGSTTDASSTSAEAGQTTGLQVNDKTPAGLQVKDKTPADGSKLSTEEQEENESPESEEVVRAAPVQHAKTKSATQRKRSKSVLASKKRSRTSRP